MKNQYKFFKTLLLGSEYLYYSGVEGNDVYFAGDGSKIFRPSAETRVLDVIKMMEFEHKNNLLSLDEIQKKEILCKSNLIMSKFMRCKKRLDILSISEEHLQKAAKIIEEYGTRNDKFKKLSLELFINQADHELENCYQYDRMKYFKLSNLKVELSMDNIELRIRGHAIAVESIFRKYRCFTSTYKDSKDELLLFPKQNCEMLMCIGRAYYYKGDMKEAMKFLDLSENDIYQGFGQNYPFVLGEVYKVKYLVYNKLGNQQKAEKMQKKYHKLCNSGCFCHAPDKYNPLLQRTSKGFHNFFCDLILMDKFGKSKNTKVEKMRKVRRCSNKMCVNLDGKNIKFKRCGRCKIALYCSRKCQIQDWKFGHRKNCSVF